MKARDIIRDALTVHLNRLSPGEAEDADTFASVLRALNLVVDEINGPTSFLFREVITSGTVAGAFGTLGTTWATISPGTPILGASYFDGGADSPLAPLTMAQYQDIPDKATVGTPQAYCHDGLSTVFLWPAPASMTIKLRTLAEMSEFADLDTDYTLPKGYRASLSALTAERIAPAMVGGISADLARAAQAARHRMSSQAARPAIVDACPTVAGNILTGW